MYKLAHFNMKKNIFNKIRGAFTAFLLSLLVFSTLALSCLDSVTSTGGNTDTGTTETNANTKIIKTENGSASYYADKFHGRTTANGEKYDKNKMTAAHKKLPFGSVVRVVNLNTNKSVTVRINDRGPFVKGRIIDLSRVAAEKLGLIQAGVLKVRVEVLKMGD
jgi:rare lipoprotein A